jgi:hypothetical protein
MFTPMFLKVAWYTGVGRGSPVFDVSAKQDILTACKGHECFDVEL